MKKLISIGVVLALLTMAVVPGAVAAQDDCGYGAENIMPSTYAKIPFAIIETGLMLVGDIVNALPVDMGIPTWIADITDAMAPWAGGPLSWTVDMLAWGVSLLGAVVCTIEPLLVDTLPAGLDLPAIFDTIACGLFQPFSCNVTGAEFTPCEGVVCLGG